MTQLLDRDFVAKRVGEGGSGISYTEFSYSLIQGYDFLHLYKEFGVNLQIAGADQWGNALSGVELVRKATGEEVHVWTAPLVINKTTGKKFGKSEGGAIWLDSKKTTIYQFYQFWLNVDDAGVIDYIKIYTLLGKDEVEALAHEHAANPEQRIAQKTLTYEVTKIVHGEEAANSVRRISEVLFGGADYTSLQTEDFLQLKAQLPIFDIKVGNDLVEALVSTELASSNTEARRFLNDGAVYLNGQQVTADKIFEANDAIASHAVLRRGKNASAVLQVTQ
jgi:tyrosyl-tRNA synthetase